MSKFSKFSKLIKFYILLLAIWAFGFLEVSNILVFPDHCYIVENHYTENSVEYNFINKDGDKCGVLLVSGYTGVWGYAYPSWNLGYLGGRDFSSKEEGFRKIEKYCENGG